MCYYASMCIHSSWFYTCCTDPALFLVLAPPRGMSLQTLAVLCGGTSCGVHCPCRQGRAVAQLVLCLLWKHLELIWFFQIPACRLGEVIPRGGKALEGGKHFKEVNHTPIHLVFGLPFPPEVSWQLCALSQRAGVSAAVLELHSLSCTPAAGLAHWRARIPIETSPKCDLSQCQVVFETRRCPPLILWHFVMLQRGLGGAGGQCGQGSALPRTWQVCACCSGAGQCSLGG